MIFANSMNALSLGAERFFREKKNGLNYIEARNAGLTTALIPVTNTFFAVGLVSLPGMMTGQILAGIDPLIAVRYQILIMTTLFGSAGLSSAVFLYLQKYDD
jgi:putative ABC transport system permease protein